LLLIFLMVGAFFLVGASNQNAEAASCSVESAETGSAYTGELPPPGQPTQQASGGAKAGPVPANILPIYRRAAQKHGIPAEILMAIGWEETRHGAGMGVSYAGATGFMQFMPATWAAYGNGGNPDNPHHAIDAAARYLVAGGAHDGPEGLKAAIFAYNHATWYVNDILTWAAQYKSRTDVTVGVDVDASALNCASEGGPIPAGIRGRIVAEAMKTLSSKTGHNYYCSFPCAGRVNEDPLAKAPWRSDCSQWVRAIYLKAGAPDPGGDTNAQSANGIRTNDPQPGDLMFTADTGHVELVIDPEKGTTIGHGSEPIDEANVSDFDGHYFVRALHG
jgi:hypothetical protein